MKTNMKRIIISTVKSMTMRTFVVLTLMASLCGIGSVHAGAGEGFLREKFPGRVSYQRKYLAGTWVYEYEYRGDVKNFQPYEYKNASNSQKVLRRDDKVIVMRNTVRVGLIESKVPYPVGDRYRVKELKKEYEIVIIVGSHNAENETRLANDHLSLHKVNSEGTAYLREIAENAAKGTNTQWEAVERVMEYLRANVKYSLGTSMHPVNVMKSGSAFCAGYAEAGVYLLRVLGIPARYKTCWIPPGHGWGGDSGGYHAFVEVYYEDLGWVSYDPQRTIHFADPYHIVEGAGSYRNQRPAGISFHHTKDRQNFVVAAKDPAFYGIFHELVIGTGRGLIEKSGARLVKCRLKNTPELGDEPPGRIRFFNAGRDREKTSIVDMVDGEFYAIVPLDYGGSFSEKINRKGVKLDILVDVPKGADEVDIDMSGKYSALSFTDRGVPLANVKIEVFSGKDENGKARFEELGFTNAAGKLFVNRRNEAYPLLRYRVWGGEAMYVADGKSEGLQEINYPLEAGKRVENFNSVHGILGTPVALAGKLIKPGEKKGGYERVSLFFADGSSRSVNVDVQGYFEHLDARKDAPRPSHIEYIGRDCYAFLKTDSSKENFLYKADLDFNSKAAMIETGTNSLMVYSPGKEGYVFNTLYPDSGKKIYFITPDSTIGVGQVREASDVMEFDYAAGKTHQYREADCPGKMLQRYREFSSRITREKGWSAAGFLKDESGSFAKAYEVYRQEKTGFARINVNSVGFFTSYGNHMPDETRMVVRSKGYYYKSGSLERGHYEMKADFSAGDFVTVKFKAQTAGGGAYIFHDNGTVGFAPYDGDLKVRIKINEPFTVSAVRDASAGVKVEKDQRNDIEL